MEIFYRLLIASVVVMAAWPAFIAVMSFIFWENFYNKGAVFIVGRISVVLVIAIWIIVLIPGGK